MRDVMSERRFYQRKAFWAIGVFAAVVLWVLPLCVPGGAIGTGPVDFGDRSYGFSRSWRGTALMVGRGTSLIHVSYPDGPDGRRVTSIMCGASYEPYMLPDWVVAVALLGVWGGRRAWGKWRRA